MFSGGLLSYATGKRLAGRGVTPALLFTDTLIEDEDLYRFVVEAGADVLGVPHDRWARLLPVLASIPPMDRPEERAGHLVRLAAAATDAVPGLHWVQDGRDPWQVFADERYLGNSRVAGCSHRLKQDVARAWLEANRDPADTVIHVGIHYSEADRFTGTGSKKGARELWLPWRCEAPMCEPPYLSEDELRADLAAAGIRRPRLYDLGFAHNNCGGFCVRAGHGHFRTLLEQLPERFAYHDRRERELRAELGKDVTILRDRRGGVTRPLPLAEFRRRVEVGWQPDLFDVGGCGCFIQETAMTDEQRLAEIRS